MAKPKKRTAAPKAAVPQPNDEDTRPIPTEKQEAEIEALRKTAEENKFTARMYLDGLVAVCLFVTGRQAWRYINNGAGPLIIGLTALQALLVPLSLSPSRLGGLGDFAHRNHPYVSAAQLAIFVAVFFLQLGKVPIADMVRSALPELLAISVDMQRRAENQNEVALAKLERLKYDHKSA